MGSIDDLPPLRDVIRRYELRPKKSLGQNFLHDLNLTARIARAAEPATPAASGADDPRGFTPGDLVEILPLGVGGAPAVAGRILGLDVDEIVIARDDARVGTVAVHFPQVGYRVTPAR